jgi:hypothetical protein
MRKFLYPGSMSEQSGKRTPFRYVHPGIDSDAPATSTSAVINRLVYSRDLLVAFQTSFLRLAAVQRFTLINDGEDDPTIQRENATGDRLQMKVYSQI